jgi:hypothetical protein
MNVQDQLSPEANAKKDKWAEAFYKADSKVFHRSCAKSKANLLRLLEAGVLNKQMAKDLAFILATHHTQYEREYMVDEDEIKATLELNEQYWAHYEIPLPL